MDDIPQQETEMDIINLLYFFFPPILPNEINGAW